MEKTRKRVLLADCHEEVLIALQKMLEDAGFDTTTAWTTRDVLDLLQSKIFDLVIVNEYLPDGECEALLRVLEKTPRKVPCIVMQPSSPEITNVKMLQRLGAREIICKYEYERIVEVVKRYLAKDAPCLVA